MAKSKEKHAPTHFEEIPENKVPVNVEKKIEDLLVGKPEPIIVEPIVVEEQPKSPKSKPELTQTQIRQMSHQAVKEYYS